MSYSHLISHIHGFFSVHGWLPASTGGGTFGGIGARNKVLGLSNGQGHVEGKNTFHPFPSHGPMVDHYPLVN